MNYFEGGIPAAPGGAVPGPPGGVGSSERGALSSLSSVREIFLTEDVLKRTR